jgi:ankyrin repeat protein
MEAIIRSSVPERYEGDISNTLQAFFDPLNKRPLLQLTGFFLYFLSNNKLTGSQEDSVFQPIIKQRAGKLLTTFFQMKSPQTQIFSEKIIRFVLEGGNLDDLQFLIDCGIDRAFIFGTMGGRNLQTVLGSSRYGVDGRAEIAEFLIANGVEVNPPLTKFRPCNTPPLHKAAKNGFPAIVERLLLAGADVNRLSVPGDHDKRGKTALEETLRNGHENENEILECIQLLLKSASNNQRLDTIETDGYPFLDWADLNYSKTMYEMVLSKAREDGEPLTARGILEAAGNGIRTLCQYMDNMAHYSEDRRRESLEYALCRAISSFLNHQDPEQIVRVLLEFGVDPNCVRNDGEIPIILAAQTGNRYMAELLVDAGADIDTPELLANAAEEDQKDHKYHVLAFLIEEGADIRRFGVDALRNIEFGVDYFHEPTLKILWLAGADMNYPATLNGDLTLLQRASSKGSLEVMRYLIGKGADVNAAPSPRAGSTAIQIAAHNDHIEVVRYLLRVGAEINADPSRNGGKTVLEVVVSCASPSQRAELFHYLLSQGANINRSLAQKTFRDWASILSIMIKKFASTELISSALDAGADVDELGEGHGARTPLQAATENGQTAIIEMLLAHGANINVPPSSDYGRTALQAICSHAAPKADLVKQFLDKGADVNAPPSLQRGLTAIQGAAIQGRMEIALLLLDAGADLNAEAAAIEGRMALDCAAEHGRLDMVQMLLNLGAESEIPGESGFDRAIEFATQYNHLAVVRILEEHAEK